MTMTRRGFAASTAAVATLAFAPRALAQAPEKAKLTLGVGGKNLLYYLPLTIAERRGYFKEYGLDVTINDFAGGARSLQALVGGSSMWWPAPTSIRCACRRRDRTSAR